MRWLAFLLLFALAVQSLPIPGWGQQPIDSFCDSGEEEVHDDCELEKNTVVEKWSVLAPSAAVQQKIVGARALTALEEASRPSSLYAPEVLTPPPNGC